MKGMILIRYCFGDLALNSNFGSGTNLNITRDFQYIVPTYSNRNNNKKKKCGC